MRYLGQSIEKALKSVPTGSTVVAVRVMVRCPNGGWDSLIGNEMFHHWLVEPEDLMVEIPFGPEEKAVRQKLKSADEQDAHSKYWRGRVFWQRRELKKIKRRTNKRLRREAAKEIEEQR